MSYVVWHQPRPMVVQSDNGEWSSGICDCREDVRDCCLGCWCLPCFACKVTHDLGHCLCLPLLDIFSCPRPIATSMRVFVRHQYDIRGSLWEDCLLSTCCLACVWCQIAREMKTRQLPVMLSDIIRR